MPETTRNFAGEATAQIAPAGESQKQQGVIATGGILGAVAAMSCCILPLALTVAGVSGAWMANLRALAPYQPVIIVLTVAFLGYGFYLVYWKPKRAGADGAVCARPVVPGKVVRGSLWMASLFVILSISFPSWVPLLVPYLP